MFLVQLAQSCLFCPSLKALRLGSDFPDCKHA